LLVLGAASLLAALLIGTLFRRDGAQTPQSLTPLTHH
jgi:hypothetical protein